MKKIYVLLIVTMLCNVAAWSQQKAITGQVRNQSNEPVPFATIKVKNTKNSVSSDQEGNFSINAPVNSTLIISSAGFGLSEIQVKDESAVVAVLSSSDPLTEVVVTALNIPREAKSLGYATQKIDGNEILKARESNVVNSLAGKVAGVRVTSQSGTLGGASKIIIRGVSSFSSNSQPIFVIDGLPIDNSSQSVSRPGSGVSPSGAASVDYGNRAADINPDNIESINVLSGAAATALYGARAKNGAIVITSKKGTKGRSNISFNSSTRFDNVLKLPDFQNQYAQGDQGVYVKNALNGWGPKIEDVQDTKFANYLGDSVTLRAAPNNVSDFYETGNTYLNSVSIDGGDENSDYRLSYANTIQDGIVANQSFVRNSLSFNAGRQISAKFKVRTNINYTGSNSKGRPVQSLNDPNVLGVVVSTIPRTLDMQLIKDNYLDPVTGQHVPLNPSLGGNNPYWLINNNGFSGNVDRIFGNVVASYQILNWLTLSNNLGLDTYNEFRKGVTRNGTYGALNGYFMEANLYNRIINNDLILSATKNITSDLNLKVLAGGNIYETFSRRGESFAQDLAADKLYNFSNAAVVTTTNNTQKKRIIGAYAEAGLSYQDFLYLNITGRNDWSSTLPVNNQSYFYPSVSAGFLFHKFIDQSWLSYGKLRSSWANVGSDDDPYLTSFTYNPASSVYTQFGFGVSFPFNNALGFNVNTVKPAFDLKPQRKSEIEIGAELGFINNRITVDFTYYTSKTSDQIVSLAAPNSTGFRTQRINAGTIKNSGVELHLGVTPVRTRNFSWNTDFNFSNNKQIITELPTSIVSTYTLATGFSSLQVRAERGQSLGIYGNGWLRDDDGNFVIDADNGTRVTVPNVRLGDLYPEWMLGINNSFTYKNFSLGFLIDIRKGGSIYSGTVSSLRLNGMAVETLAGRDGEFIDPGVNLDGDDKYVANTTPVNAQNFWNKNYAISVTEANVFDASYAKLREVRIAYMLPSSLLKKSGFIKSVEVGLEGRNLLIIHDNIPHIDPEVNSFTNAQNAAVGEAVEYNAAPSARSLGFNVRFKF